VLYLVRGFTLVHVHAFDKSMLQTYYPLPNSAPKIPQNTKY